VNASGNAIRGQATSAFEYRSLADWQALTYATNSYVSHNLISIAANANILSYVLNGVSDT
jgi:hypothetical protein